MKQLRQGLNRHFFFATFVQYFIIKRLHNSKEFSLIIYFAAYLPYLVFDLFFDWICFPLSLTDREYRISFAYIGCGKLTWPRTVIWYRLVFPFIYETYKTYPVVENRQCFSLLYTGMLFRTWNETGGYDVLNVSGILNCHWTGKGFFQIEWTRDNGTNQFSIAARVYVRLLTTQSPIA